MQLLKKLYNYTLKGTTLVPKGDTLTVESGGTLNAASGSTFKLGGTAITATAAEINDSVAGLTATAAELNRTSDVSARVVNTTATALSLTVTQHAERTVFVATNSTVANTFTLPVATGSGAKFTIVNNIAQTQGSVVVAANGTDVISGLAIVVSSTEEAAAAFLTSATSDKVTFNLTTTGGLGYDMVEAIDKAANTWHVRVTANGNGTLATPFSAT